MAPSGSPAQRKAKAFVNAARSSEFRRQGRALVRPAFTFRGEANRLTGGMRVFKGSNPSMIDGGEEAAWFGAMAAGVSMAFRCKIAGIRHLPRHERLAATRVFNEERKAALLVLRKRRQAERLGRKWLRQQVRQPSPD